MNRHYIIGIDEAGRGAWAGPVVAGGFMIEKEFLSNLSTLLPGIKDSKKLKKQERESIYATIEYLTDKHECQYTFAYRDADIIDSVGIREANRLCMEDIILSFLQFVGPQDTVEVWIDGCDNYQFAVDDFDYSFAKKKVRGKTVQIPNPKSIALIIDDKNKNGESEGGKMNGNEEIGNKILGKTGRKTVQMGAWGEDTVGTEMKNSTMKSEASTEGVWLPTNSFGTFGNKSTGNQGDAEINSAGQKLDNNITRIITYLINGDNHLPIISLGGIIAKVIRDRMMCEYSEDFPEYGFDEHVGYGTRKHQSALNNYNITSIHRKSYAPVKRLISLVS